MPAALARSRRRATRRCRRRNAVSEQIRHGSGILSFTSDRVARAPRGAILHLSTRRGEGAEVLARAGSQRIGNSNDAAALFAMMFRHEGVEELRIAHVDSERRLIAVCSHASGGVDHVDLPLQEIAREALVLQSHGILMAHNHPSGDPTPSRSDIAATRALSELAERLNIRLYDHLIFARDGWSSLMTMGLL